MSAQQLPRWLVLLTLVWAPGQVAAQDKPNALLDFRFTPAPRSQIAIWIEDPAGNYITTVRLTDAVAYRGIGNRPGASQMNSGYRWPYGRREGVLPRWASQRAEAQGGKQFKRVIFQNRVEGLASRTASDQSVDDYYCLSFTNEASQRDALDAVSCASASAFMSDKGRYLTLDDVDYVEPYEALMPPHVGGMALLPITSRYPPRMDVMRCSQSGCFDHEDVDDFAAHARDVMPGIDAISMATPEGSKAQSELFSVPQLWPRGHYVAWVEVNIEGDYVEPPAASGPDAPVEEVAFDDLAYPTPTTPSSMWDSWAIRYGYPYRGQPSVVYRVPFELGDVGVTTISVDAPEGRTSWDHWGDGYGRLESMDGMTNDPGEFPGSGADRMQVGNGGGRIVLVVETLGDLPAPEDVPDPAVMPPDGPSEQVEAGEAVPWVAVEDTTSESGAQILMTANANAATPVGAVLGLELSYHPDERHQHDWINVRFIAVDSEEPLHEYQVRVATRPIIDEVSFLRFGREARTATESLEGATGLTLPSHTTAGSVIKEDIGDLEQLTHYYVAVRAVDRFNRAGPISVAEITTRKQVFTTVSPCFVATAVYGSPVAAEVGVLRRFRDRLLLPLAPGRALVSAYYRHGAAWAAYLREHDDMRAVARDWIDSLVQALKRFDS